MCVNWFLVNSGSSVAVFACYQAIWKRYLTVLYDLLGKLDASILFVQVFLEFSNFVFVYSSDRIVNVT